jgi:phosphopantothenoylcysteine decarboxylase/phosphopantothenate--cysteine ligase
MNPLTNKRIILGVTGSIACYKTADLASKLRQAGAEVDVILSEAAAKMISPITFHAVTGRKAYVDVDLWSGDDPVLHISLGKAADLFVVAPATANTLFKLAYGEAGSLLTLTALASECPLLLAPAMEGGMYSHTAMQTNLSLLKQRGAYVVGPEAGHLASGTQQVGRMSEPATILGHIRLLLAQDGPLAGKKVVVTAGGTQEPIDPVRFIANRSSGKQGFALAQAALDLGASVTLVTAPVSLDTPIGAQRVEVRTAQEMLDVVLEHSAEADALLMAAAVADFQPADAADQKIKKGKQLPEIKLTYAPDVLKAMAERKGESGFPKVTVGFAAESQELVANASKKLADKKLDLIVANDISASDAGFAMDTNRVTLLFAGGGRQELPLLTKDEVAAEVLSHVVQLLEQTNS